VRWVDAAGFRRRGHRGHCSRSRKRNPDRVPSGRQVGKCGGVGGQGTKRTIHATGWITARSGCTLHRKGSRTTDFTDADAALEAAIGRKRNHAAQKNAQRHRKTSAALRWEPRCFHSPDSWHSLANQCSSAILVPKRQGLPTNDSNTANTANRTWRSAARCHGTCFTWWPRQSHDTRKPDDRDSALGHKLRLTRSLNGFKNVASGIVVALQDALSTISPVIDFFGIDADTVMAISESEGMRDEG
jgi:hypothetical protein